MKIKPLYLLNVVLAIVLLTSIFANAAINRTVTADIPEYDPWKDLNQDGKINLSDLIKLAKYFGTEGTPINTTALLLELQSDIHLLSLSLSALQAKVNQLEGNLSTIITAHEPAVQILTPLVWTDLISVSDVQLLEGADVMLIASFTLQAVGEAQISMNVSSLGYDLRFKANNTYSEERVAFAVGPNLIQIHHTWMNLTGGPCNFTLQCMVGADASASEVRLTIVGNGLLE